MQKVDICDKEAVNLLLALFSAKTRCQEETLLQCRNLLKRIHVAVDSVDPEVVRSLIQQAMDKVDATIAFYP